MTAHVDLSVIVPVYNERENIDSALAEILAVLDGMPQRSEVIVVDDGSRDGTGQIAARWNRRDERVRVIHFRRNFGQTAAIMAGFRFARGECIAVIDGDMQNDPRDLPKLLATMADGYDVVSGWRRDRKDRLFSRKIPSWIANRLISRITGVRLHDYGCSLKAYRREVVRHLNLYGELHRFIPALAGLVGARVAEVPVNHRPRLRGRSKYGISRTVRVLLDLVTVKFLLKYLARPMQFFGLLGILSLIAGVLTLTGLLAAKLVTGMGITDKPLFLLGILSVIVGGQFFSMGLLGELLTRVYHEVGRRDPYVIREAEGVTLPPASVPDGALQGAGPSVEVAGRSMDPVSVPVAASATVAPTGDLGR